jgi:glutathione S-transferase
MSSLILYHNDMSVCAAKVRMALAEKRLNWEGRHLNLRAGDTHKPEYVKLNPKKVVPTLVVDEVVLIESNIICEFVDERWPESPLRPSSAEGRAAMRLWMRRLDDEIHGATGTVSTCIAFRFQQMKRSREDLEAWLGNMEPQRSRRLKSSIENGMEAPEFGPAVDAFMRLADDFDQALSSGDWLVEDTFSLADLAYASYLVRLEHLGLFGVIERHPRVRRWKERIMERPAFDAGIAQWFNQDYMRLFAENRDRARRYLAQRYSI